MNNIMLLIVALLLLVFIQTYTPYDDTDNKENNIRSDMHLHTDHKTGCQYLSGWSGILIPRVNARGEHICGNM